MYEKRVYERHVQGWHIKSVLCGKGNDDQMRSKDIHEKSPWQDITEGNQIYEAATSRRFHTGEWRTSTPVYKKEQCRQCLLIPVSEGKRQEFDYDHCKGCGICAKVCPFGAIEMKEGK